MRFMLQFLTSCWKCVKIMKYDKNATKYCVHIAKSFAYFRDIIRCHDFRVTKYFGRFDA